MPRPLRFEYPDALYHVTARGVQQGPIFLDDRDRQLLLTLLARTLFTYEARAFAYCLMGNHCHLVLHTRHANLSTLMQRLNASYCQQFNRRHTRQGQVFGGRFKAVHVERDAYLLAVSRYVDLNPVRAGLTRLPASWAWSSYRAHTGTAPSTPWLATSALHGVLTGQPLHTDAQIETAHRSHADWVAAGQNVQLWKESLRHGLHLGDDAFVERTIAAARQGT